MILTKANQRNPFLKLIKMGTIEAIIIMLITTTKNSRIPLLKGSNV